MSGGEKGCGNEGRREAEKWEGVVGRRMLDDFMFYAKMNVIH